MSSSRLRVLLGIQDTGRHCRQDKFLDFRGLMQLSRGQKRRKRCHVRSGPIERGLASLVYDLKNNFKGAGEVPAGLRLKHAVGEKFQWIKNEDPVALAAARYCDCRNDILAWRPCPIQVRPSRRTTTGIRARSTCHLDAPIACQELHGAGQHTEIISGQIGWMVLQPWRHYHIDQTTVFPKGPFGRRVRQSASLFLYCRVERLMFRYCASSPAGQSMVRSAPQSHHCKGLAGLPPRRFIKFLI